MTKPQINAAAKECVRAVVESWRGFMGGYHVGTIKMDEAVFALDSIPVMPEPEQGAAGGALMYYGRRIAEALDDAMREGRPLDERNGLKLAAQIVESSLRAALSQQQTPAPGAVGAALERLATRIHAMHDKHYADGATESTPGFRRDMAMRSTVSDIATLRLALAQAARPDAEVVRRGWEAHARCRRFRNGALREDLKLIAAAMFKQEE